MQSIMLEPQTYNQWYAPEVHRVIEKMAIIENKKFPHSVDFYIDALEMTWLNISVPAGNA